MKKMSVPFAILSLLLIGACGGGGAAAPPPDITSQIIGTYSGTAGITEDSCKEPPRDGQFNAELSIAQNGGNLTVSLSTSDVEVADMPALLTERSLAAAYQARQHEISSECTIIINVSIDGLFDEDRQLTGVYTFSSLSAFDSNCTDEDAAQLDLACPDCRYRLRFEMTKN